MFQLDESAELQEILDGVFKAPKREERRTRQRYSRRGLMHHPLSLNYLGDGVKAGPAATAQMPAPGHASANAAVSNAPGSITLASTEELIRNSYAEGRVINPPPPAVASEAGVAADLYGLGYIPQVARIWSEDK